MIAATQSNLLRVGDPKENGTPTLVMRLNKKSCFRRAKPEKAQPMLLA